MAGKDACVHDPAQFVTADEGTSYCPACEADVGTAATGVRTISSTSVEQDAKRIDGALTGPEPGEAQGEAAASRSCQGSLDGTVPSPGPANPTDAINSGMFAAHIRATALAVLNKESDAWTHVEWSKAAIALASAIVAAVGDIDKVEL